MGHVDCDVAIVGARCAGAPLATLLARSGLRVVVLEQATFPRDTMSTHIMEANGVAFLDRLGVADRVKQTGAPFHEISDARFEDLRLVRRIPSEAGDIGGGASVRRFVLDPILAEAATEAGVDVRMGATVAELLRSGDRVTGVRYRRDGVIEDLTARLVVGADGRNSTVARLAGARKYNVVPSQKFVHWGFYEGADLSGPATIVFHRWKDRLIIACPADSGLYQVVMMLDPYLRDRFRADLLGSFDEVARSCEPVAAVLSQAKVSGKVFGMVHWEGYFRDATGPGWVLVGDAGNFKDPAPGQGIGDAFRQVDELAPAIVKGLEANSLDECLIEWGRWRDSDAQPMSWLAADLGKEGPTPMVVVEISRRLESVGRYDEVMRIFAHRQDPTKIFTPGAVMAATARLMFRRGTPRRQLLKEVRTLIAEDMKRQKLNKTPAYAAGADNAGETEVD
jgi:2-polyprenyl-6-methoxyphenol hydroxylase-like FAD-dependent oxidoreductase